MRRFPSVRSLVVTAAVLTLLSLTCTAPSFAQIGIAVSFGPPALPVYEQPPCPEDGYLWTPGYWAYDYDDADYYWVPGTWVMAPEAGLLWTPGYWGWGGEGFLFHEGYWGAEVGFYGGIAYGFGYFGEGFEGGRWDHDHFFYNRSVTNVNVTNIHNVYNTTVINNTNVSRVSYNGGDGGVNRRPTPQEEKVSTMRHIPPVAVQTQHMQAARTDPQQRASVNHGKPEIAATGKPGDMRSNAVPAKEAGAPYQAPPNRGNAAGRPASGNENRPGNANNNPGNNANNNGARPGNVVHAGDLPPRDRTTPANTGNPKTDQKYQQQQQKLFAKQDKEQQKLQQQQEKDHQKMAKQMANENQKQQIEQRHQQQTQQLQQRHEQQQQQLQQRQSPPPNRGETKPQRPPGL